MLAGCDDGLTDPSAEGPAPQGAAATASAKPDNGPPGDLVTNSPKRLAEALRAIGNEDEVLVALKAKGAPRVASSQLKEMSSGSVVAGVPETRGSAKRRSTPGFARSGRAAYNGVMQALEAKGVEPYRAHPEAEIMSVRIPDAKLVPVLAVLMKHPNVDYIEANQKRKVVFDGAASLDPATLSFEPRIYAGAVAVSTTSATPYPEGSNPADDKHTFHNVLDAWDYTRGSGAKVGILDSGFAYDQATGDYHLDGQLLTSTKGIKKKGFVDDYDDYNNCDANGGQPYGNCPPWDDNSHGTAMSGIPGANDNSRGSVGIMPEGLTVSMKISQNCYISDDGCGRYLKFEDDDFYWAVNWASQDADIGVLSMSFSFTEGAGASSDNALYDAYNNYDILLLSSTGNDNNSDSQRYPQERPFVMGVGGLYYNGTSYGKEKYEEVSALYYAKTTEAYCPSSSSFCEPDGTGRVYGTSPATATTAGIAGLVRAYNPGLSAQQVRRRLDDTARGSHDRVDALAAVTGDYPLTVSISGPGTVDTGQQGTWTASASGIDESSVTYTWKWDGSQVKQETVSAGSGSSYSRTPYSVGGHTVSVKAVSGSEEAGRQKSVYVRDSDCGTQITC